MSARSDGRADLPQEAERVLDFWFGPLDDDGLAGADRRQRWWQSDEEFDREVRRRFLDTWKRAVGRELDHWAETPRGRVALVVVLDQFPRNMFRGDAEMFASDRQALELCVEGIDLGHDRSLESDLGAFFYLPLMHSEQRSDQHLGMRMYAELVERSPAGAREQLENNHDFMRRHFEIVDRFGRFPHRNAVLGRSTTEEEEEFLKQPGSSF